jgi:Ran GTPase-activating protein (RanGAP) involved in mRNA processing and transport
LLGFSDAELIAGMLRKNTSLRILNLSHNNFDYNAGRIIGDSLLYNDNLQSLNMAYNRLGDMGVRHLLWGLIILGCRKHGVNQQP